MKRVKRGTHPDRGTGRCDSPSRSTIVSIVLASIALIVLVASTYRRAPDNDFHFDDLANIRENAAVRMTDFSIEGLKQAATQSPLKRRPLAYATFAFDWWRGGGAPRTFLLTNMTIHVVNSMLVFGLFLLALSGIGDPIDERLVFGSAVGAALWALHPIQVQAVTYIVQRMTELACLFTVSGVGLYVWGRRSKSRRGRIGFLILAVVALLCGAISKENAWISPVLIVLAELGVVRRDQPLIRNRTEGVLLGGMATAGLAVFLLTLAGIGPLAARFARRYATRDFEMIERVLTEPRVVLFHLSQITWPLPGRFSLEHDFPVSTSPLNPITTLLSLAAVLFWCALGLWILTRRGRRHLGFFLLWPPVSLLVESTVVPLEIVFEHRMYLPSVGLFGLLAAIAAASFRRGRRSWLVVAIGVLIALFAASTASRVSVWRSELTLARDAVRRAPGSPRAIGRLGHAYLVEGSVEEAESALRRALRLEPDQRIALEYLGVILMDRGDLEKAETLLTRARLHDPESASLANHLGELMLKKGRYDRAASLFGEAMAQKPWVPAYYWNRALASEAMGRCEEAFADWNRYLEVERDTDERSTVIEHLRENYENDGGKCLSATAPKQIAGPQSESPVP